MARFVWALSTLVALASATCYTRNGTVITDIAYQPCSNDTSHASACCGINHSGAGHVGIADDMCDTNGLCQNWGAATQENPDPPLLWWRQGCTDPTWESPYCLKDVCNSEPWLDDNAPVNKCNAQQWCCGEPDCCKTSTNLFTLAATIGPTATSTSQPPTSAATTTAVALTGTPTGTNSDPMPSSSGLSTGAKAGIGVGAAVGAVLFGVIAFLLWKLQKRRGDNDAPKHWLGNEKQQSTVYAHEAEHQVAPVEIQGHEMAVESGGTIRAELMGSEGSRARNHEQNK